MFKNCLKVKNLNIKQDLALLGVRIFLVVVATTLLGTLLGSGSSSQGTILEWYQYIIYGLGIALGVCFLLGIFTYFASLVTLLLAIGVAAYFYTISYSESGTFQIFYGLLGTAFNIFIVVIALFSWILIVFGPGKFSLDKVFFGKL